jgi:predicted DsbA family dithiol-disulfide isomerase
MSMRTHAQLSGIRVSRRRVEVVCVAISDPISFEVFFDYQCPFVFRVAGLLDGVRASGERDFKVGWRYFSLTQVNSNDHGWTVWGAPAEEKVRGRLAFQAAEAARRQGRFDALHGPLLDARHIGRLDLDDHAVVEQVAERSGLDMSRFREDLADPSVLEALARDHRQAVSELGIFGTPTFVFEDGAAAYVRLAQPVNGTSPVDVFDRLVGVAAGEPRILEIKRPRRPNV